MRATLVAVLLSLVAAAPAAAAPAYTGTAAPGAPYSWTGGPLLGASLIGEPCGTTHTCEDVLVTVTVPGTLEIAWKASAPGDQAWLFANIFEANEDGSAGKELADGGGLANEGRVSADVAAGKFVVTMGALLAAPATYEATATLEPDAPVVATPPPATTPAPAASTPAPAAKPKPKKKARKKASCKKRKGHKRPKRCTKGRPKRR